MRRLIVAGNWKMFGSKRFVAEYAATLARVRTSLPGKRFPEAISLVLFPPVAYLGYVLRQLDEQGLVDSVEVGGQDLHAAAEGAYTGSIAGEMLKDIGATWVLVGHSERRQAGETDEMVAEKFAAALRAGLKPVLCIGETESERDSGNAESVVLRQIEQVAARVGAEGLGRGVIAYEPVWAIGTGKTATPALAQAMHRVIRQALAGLAPDLGRDLALLYGGSVKPANAAELFAQPDIDGGLIGGASLEAAQFLEIAQAGRSAAH
ncbi:MAG: triose-phosphate isomerase [Pseudomonadales bacterium]